MLQINSPDHCMSQTLQLLPKYPLKKILLVTSAQRVDCLVLLAYQVSSQPPFSSKCVVGLLSNSQLDPVYDIILDILHSADKYAGSRLCYSHRRMPYRVPSTLSSKYQDLFQILCKYFFYLYPILSLLAVRVSPSFTPVRSGWTPAAGT
jgi:hypothetical protein